MTKTRALFFSGLGGLAVLGLTLLQVRGARPPAEATPTPATRIGDRVAAEGRVVTYPGGEVVVGAERAGRLVQFLVEEGQSVRRGQLLAALESEELQAALDQARAREAETAAELRLAELTLVRREGLASEGVLSVHDLDEARRDLDIARARLETATADAARHQAQLNKSRVHAPIDGTVIARHADGGEMVEAGDRVATLADLGRLRVEAEADESDAGRVAVGAVVQIAAHGYPDAVWEGRVEEVADAVTLRRLKPQDPGRPTDTRVLTVKVAFLEPSPLKLGTTVDLKILPR